MNCVRFFLGKRLPMSIKSYLDYFIIFAKACQDFFTYIILQIMPKCLNNKNKSVK